MSYLRRINFLSLILQTLSFYVFCSLQTTLWPQLMGSVVAPSFWLVVLFYVILYRSRTEAILVVYFYLLIVGAFTSAPIGVMFTSVVLIYAVLVLLKDRLFWPGPQYFLLASVFGVASFELIYLVVCWIVEINPSPVIFLPRIGEVFFTTLSALPVYWWLHQLDQWTGKSVAISFDESEARG